MVSHFQIDILGQQIWEYSHQCDHDELKEALNIKKNGLTEKVKDENLMEEGITTDHRDLFIRLKCTLTSRGRSVNIKSATYKVRCGGGLEYSVRFQTGELNIIID